MSEFKLLKGDCLETLKTLDDNSIDAIVTDPPYGLEFMGKEWDKYTPLQFQQWCTLWTTECLRVLKPGGHILAFGGTRTYHRLTSGLEDAGFEIRDSIHWTYGSGFPKSLDVSKAIDKQRDDREDVYRVTTWIRAARDAAGISNRDIDAAFGFAGMASHWTSAKSQPTVPTLEQVPQLLGVLGVTLDDVPDDIRDLLWTLNGRKGQPGPNWAKREVTGHHDNAAPGQIWKANYGLRANLTSKERRDAPATPEAQQWQGWGTALKPSHEPIVLARKPLVGTVANNVLTHGTGALNIDGCRVGTDGGCVDAGPTGGNDKTVTAYGDGLKGRQSTPVQGMGRWPSNTILTHSAGCQQTGTTTEQVQQNTAHKGKRKSDGWGLRKNETTPAPVTVPTYECELGCPVGLINQQQTDTAKFYQQTQWTPQDHPPFIYQPKTSGKERKEAGLKNTHPTVKPVKLMEYLITLITPPNGTVLDPFLGSGTTAVAALNLGFNVVGCEKTEEYYPIIEARTQHALAEKDATLF